MVLRTDAPRQQKLARTHPVNRSNHKSASINHAAKPIPRRGVHAVIFDMDRWALIRFFESDEQTAAGQVRCGASQGGKFLVQERQQHAWPKKTELVAGLANFSQSSCVRTDAFNFGIETYLISRLDPDLL